MVCVDSAEDVLVLQQNFLSALCDIGGAAAGPAHSVEGILENTAENRTSAAATAVDMYQAADAAEDRFADAQSTATADTQDHTIYSAAAEAGETM